MPTVKPQLRGKRLRARREQLLGKVIEAIEYDPRRMAMDTWLSVFPYTSPAIPRCGTVGCIAGWTVLADRAKQVSKSGGFTEIPYKTIASKALATTGYRAIERTAATLLGLTKAETGRLFYSSEWPDEFRLAYYGAIGAAACTKVTVERIKHFLTTGE